MNGKIELKQTVENGMPVIKCPKCGIVLWSPFKSMVYRPRPFCSNCGLELPKVVTK